MAPETSAGSGIGELVMEGQCLVVTADSVGGTFGEGVPEAALWHGRAYQSSIQLTSTALVYFGLVCAAYQCYVQHLAVALALAAMAGLTLVRLFIFQHDCAHYSFFRSRRANDICGLMLGMLTLAPHHYWRSMHILHHSSSGNLCRRGWGDIYTMTSSEYQQASLFEKVKYRIYRHPLAMVLLGPLYQFVLRFRWPATLPIGIKGKRAPRPDASPQAPRRGQGGLAAALRFLERRSVALTNTALALIHLSAFVYLDYSIFLVLALVIVQVSAMTGIVLFYVQHQLETPYWVAGAAWSAKDAALHGSSHLHLPRVIERFVVAINLHHVHHLKPMIVNYRLREYMLTHGLSQHGVPIYPSDIWRLLQLKIYDESLGVMTGFKCAPKLTHRIGAEV